MKRGIIITPNYKVLDSGGLQLTGDVEAVNLRKYLLFWDEIDYPVNDMIHISGGPDIEFLIQEGIATSTEVRFQRMEAHENGLLFLASQMVAFEQNNKAEDKEWSIAQPTQKLIVPQEYSKKQGCLEFELYNAVQIPTADVPLSEVVEFKMRRNAELLALRDSMDSIVDQIMSSQDIPKRKNKALNKLHRDLNDFNRVMKETKFQRVKRSLTSVATDPWFAVAGAGALAKDYLPENYQPYVQGLNVAALGTCALKFAYQELSVGKSIPDEFRHFAYLSAMRNELV
ncbi:DUF6236 family protein [Pseudoalteromonas luteoviolacea]|uniref:DUF6236 family protein n=1 Tax=Pseudoalteromonas luteoviolacea TaxID=43657 RepID=UPI001F15E2F5|nr:DUF6236 family protein [Pseudoalteromonas luteoviolacea]MCF6439521.1 DUF6236 family protein [Pseudoalteromonas luteoviolacea]